VTRDRLERDGGEAAFRRPTINDVAALSGVSKSTVSNVMRGTGSVSDATRRRVVEAVDRLGYRPNATARNLVMQRTNLIGVVVGDLANDFDAELVKRIEQQASAAGYTTLVCNTGGHAEREGSRIEASTASRSSTSRATARCCHSSSVSGSRSRW
jgi:DNA-binding LacI/PurR family transcriptional regulator